MLSRAQITIPSLVRVKPGAIDRIGIYLARQEYRRAVMLTSSGLDAALIRRAGASLAENQIALQQQISVEEASFERATAIFTGQPGPSQRAAARLQEAPEEVVVQ